MKTKDLPKMEKFDLIEIIEEYADGNIVHKKPVYFIELFQGSGYPKGSLSIKVTSKLESEVPQGYDPRENKTFDYNLDSIDDIIVYQKKELSDNKH